MVKTVCVPVEPTDEMHHAGQELMETHNASDIYRAMLAASPQGEGSSATPIPTETAAAAVVSVPRDQLETLRRSLELGNLLPGEGESLIILWLMIADAEART